MHFRNIFIFKILAPNIRCCKAAYACGGNKESFLSWQWRECIHVVSRYSIFIVIQVHKVRELIKFRVVRCLNRSLSLLYPYSWYRKWLFCYYVGYFSLFLKFAENEDFILCSSDLYALFNGKRWVPFYRFNKLVEESFYLMLWYTCTWIYKPTTITYFSYFDHAKLM